MDVLQQIRNEKVICVLRGYSRETAVQVAGKLLDGGIRCLEVTMETENAAEIIRALVERFDRALVGAGTVLSKEDGTRAAEAGAGYALSPVFDPDVVSHCQSEGLVVAPGCLTPTEARNAYQHGADAVKVFPACSVGPSFVKKLRGPLPDIPVIPTGGIGLSNAVDYLEAGAVAVGAGSYLVPDDLVDTGEFKTIGERARNLREAVDGVERG